MKQSRTASFHDEEFDEGTLLKLKLFRAYVREWLPVFLSKGLRRNVNVFDFFAGPGSDAKGNPGSPRIILEEAKQYYASRAVSPSVQLSLYLNDRDQAKAARLRELVAQYSDMGWQIGVTALDFEQLYAQYVPLISDDASANLLIIDQFGYRHMPPDRFAQIAGCSMTDVICFMASSNIRRFVRERAVQGPIGIPPDEIESLPAGEAHRRICDFYRSRITEPTQYYVAPFTIRDGANYYGLMFGTASLRGLEKFLICCWGLDEFTGEANFAIDNDPIVKGHGQLSLVEADNVPRKQREFKSRLTAFLREGRSNQEVYRFTLENGFLGKHAKEWLRSFERAGLLAVNRLDPSARSGYYLSWKDHTNARPRALFAYRG